MTKEENIATLNEHLTHWKRLLSEKICDQSEGEKTIDALQNAIKALEQETCEDCIRRLDIGLTDFEIIMCNGDYREGLKILLEKIAYAPSVTPQPNIGHWIYTGNYITDGMLKCSECGFKHDVSERFSYCPNCGSKNSE